MDDRTLLRKLKKGDDGALHALIGRYSAYLYTVAANILREELPPEDIEEVVSDVFLSLWNNRGKIEPVSLQSYLAAMARNSARNRLRAKKPTVPLEDDLLTVQPAAEGLEESLHRKQLCHQVSAAVDAMGEPDREIFLRYYYFYQKTSEIAGRMKLTEPAVRARLHRGRKKLKAWLAERGDLREDSDF